MSKLSKTPKPNIYDEDLSKNRSILDFMDKDAFMLFPDKSSWRQKFIHTMLKWAEKEDSVEIVDFTYSMKMRRRLLYEWIDRYQDIREAYEEVKLIVGARRRKGALFRKYDKDVAFKDMYKYDPEWLDIDKYQAALKNIESAEQKPVEIVYLQQFPSTTLVPEKKNE